MLEVTPSHISRLSPTQLTKLLYKLLVLEAYEEGLPLGGVDVPFEICVPDGGEDGRIEWENGPDRTDFIPHRLTCFQVKAEYLTPKKFANEVGNEGTHKLKPRVEECLENGGFYVFFCAHEYNPSLVRTRITKIEQRLVECGAREDAIRQVDIYGAQRIGTWVNKFPAAALYVLESVGEAVPTGILSLEQWCSYEENQGPYFKNDFLAGLCERIRATVSEARSILRVEGDSGLGKSRLVTEALASRGDDARPPHDNVVFYDARYGREQALVIAQWLSRRGITCTYVVDECPADLHELLKREALSKSSKISLITLDYEKVQDSSADCIELSSDDLKEVVEQMVEHNFSTISKWDRERICKLASGFPQIAANLAGSLLNDDSAHLGVIEDSRLFDRIIWRRETPVEVERATLRAISLFSYIPFSEDFKDERNWIAERIALLTPRVFFESCQKLIQKTNLLEQRGRYLRLTPEPVCLSLAEEWWNYTPPEDAVRVVRQILKSNLRGPFLKRFRNFDYLDAARAAVRSLLSDSGLEEDVERGFQYPDDDITSAFAEVEPEAVLTFLERTSSAWTIEDWGKESSSLPRFYWTMVKLCWWPNLFNRSANLMLSAVSNPRDQGNSQGQGSFLGLFGIGLPGTRADLPDRLPVLKDGLNRSNKTSKELCVRALGAALDTSMATRMGGVEAQGSRKTQFERPPSLEEISCYWKECLRLLETIVTTDAEFSDLACKLLGENLRGLANLPWFVESLDSTIERISDFRRGYWPSARDQLIFFLNYEKPEASRKCTTYVERWLSMLQPEDLVDRIRGIVDKPSYDHFRDEGGEFIDQSELDAIDFAEELSQHDFDWTDYRDLLLFGQQRQGFPFGKRLAENTKDQEGLLGTIRFELENVDQEHVVLNFVAGCLAGVTDSNIVDEFFKSLYSDCKLHRFVLPLFRQDRHPESHLDQIVVELKSGSIPINHLGYLQYNPVMKSLPSTTTCDFLAEMCEISEEASLHAINIIHSITHQKPISANLLPITKTLLSLKGLRKIAHVYDIDEGTGYHINELTKKYLDHRPDDLDFVAMVCLDLRFTLEELSTPQLISYSPEFKPDFIMAVELLLRNFPDIIWSHFEPLLLGEPTLGRATLMRVLGPGEFDNTTKALVHVLPDDFLIRWCTTTEKARVIADIVVLLSRDNEWTPLADYLFDNFFDDGEVRDRARSNIEPRSASGSWAPYFRRVADALKNLIDHDVSQVSQWARRLAERYDERTEREEQADDEDDIRRN